MKIRANYHKVEVEPAEMYFSASPDDTVVRELVLINESAHEREMRLEVWGNVKFEFPENGSVHLITLGPGDEYAIPISFSPGRWRHYPTENDYVSVIWNGPRKTCLVTDVVLYGWVLEGRRCIRSPFGGC